MFEENILEINPNASKKKYTFETNARNLYFRGAKKLSPNYTHFEHAYV